MINNILKNGMIFWQSQVNTKELGTCESVKTLFLVLRLGPQKSLDYHPHVDDASSDIKIIQNLQSK